MPFHKLTTEAMIQVEIAECLHVLHDEIARQMAPFNPGRVKVWQDFDIDRNVEWFVVKISTLPDTQFKGFGSHEMSRASMSTSLGLAEKLGRKAGRYFARQREPITGDIVLGEN